MRPKSFCKIWLRKCVHNTLMLVMVGVGLQEQLADIATTQVRNARLVPKYSAKVRRALGLLRRSAAHTKWPHPLDHFSGNASQLARCGPRTSVQSAQHLCKSATQLTQMLRQLHPQRLQDCNLQICLLTNWIQIGF